VKQLWHDYPPIPRALYRKERYAAVLADPKQVMAGIRVEREHTDSDETAYIIALDHLAEIPDYYTLLLKMERNAR
jgi:hypothetical protein